MNEQIRELYLQSHSIRHHDGDPPTVFWQGEVSAQRFAELIVRECIDILMQPKYAMTVENPNDLSPYNEGWVSGRRLGIEHIRQHFGVKL